MAGRISFDPGNRDVQPQRAHRSRSSARSSTARATTKIETDTSSLKLQLRTADGDTVEISIDAQHLRQTERGTAQGPDGRVAQRSKTESDSLTASVKVTGDLNDQELGDIKDLLASLSSGQTPTAGEGGKDGLDTISAYSFAYQHSHQVSRSTVQLTA